MNTIVTRTRHYYGNIVRIVFLAGAGLMIVGLPTVTQVFGIPVGLAIAGIVVLVVAAGSTNPAQKWSLVANSLVAVAYTVIFAYYAWYSYTQSITGGFMAANQLAALAFVVASYLAIKSWRGTEVPEIGQQ